MTLQRRLYWGWTNQIDLVTSLKLLYWWKIQWRHWGCINLIGPSIRDGTIWLVPWLYRGGYIGDASIWKVQWHHWGCYISEALIWLVLTSLRWLCWWWTNQWHQIHKWGINLIGPVTSQRHLYWIWTNQIGPVTSQRLVHWRLSNLIGLLEMDQSVWPSDDIRVRCLEWKLWIHNWDVALWYLFRIHLELSLLLLSLLPPHSLNIRNKQAWSLVIANKWDGRTTELFPLR